MAPSAADETRVVLADPHAPESATAKRRVVHTLFTTIAPRYDWFNRLASCFLDQGWRRRAVALARVAPGMRVLDACSGTGDLAVLCAQRIGGQGTIIGLDFNEAMLRGARHKRFADAVGWLCGDAQALPFADGTFDRVVIGFSTRNLTDLTQGVREMARVLKPGGELAILETGRPANPLVRAGYLLFLGTVVRVIGVLLTGRLWPFTYLARSVKGFIAPEEFVARLRRVGLQPRYVPLSGGLASLYLSVKP